MVTTSVLASYRSNFARTTRKDTRIPSSSTMPSEVGHRKTQTLTAEHFAYALIQAGVPENVIQVVHMDGITDTKQE